MHKPGHVGGALLAYTPLLAWLLATDRYLIAAVGLIATLATAMLPDSDFDVPGMKHRGFSHTILCAALIVGAVACICLGLGVPDPIMIGLTVGTAVGVGSHILLDATTPMGVKLFWPVSGWRVRLPPGFTSANRWSNVLLLLAGVGSIGAVVLFDTDRIVQATLRAIEQLL